MPDIIGKDEALAMAIHKGSAMKETKSPETKSDFNLNVICFKK